MTLYGSNFEGGHFSRSGTGPDGRTVPVPLYRHEVAIDYIRIELGLGYTLTEKWDVIARIPWEEKQQTAAFTLVDPAPPVLREAMDRNMHLHHRSVTLRGMSDLMFLGRRRWSSAWREGDSFSFSAGASVPTGHTVDNPYRLGDQGIPHLHIQFGTGTFDPLLEGSYSTPIGSFDAGAYLAGRYSLYENRRSFRAPPEATLGVHVAAHASARLQIRLEAALYAQGYGYWSGERDENTGLVAASLTPGVTFRFSVVSLSADLRYPISQRTLSEGDVFTQGPAVVITIGGQLP